MVIYALLASLLFFSTPSISYEDDDPYYSDVEYCDVYQYCDNPDLDPEYLFMFSGGISDYIDDDFDGGDVEWETVEEEKDTDSVELIDVLWIL